MDIANLKKMKKMDRTTLERLVVNLWDELYCDCEEPCLTFTSNEDDRYVKHLESEVDRLNKAVSGMYQDIKMKSLRFMVDARPNDTERDIFCNCFKNYLK